MFSTLFVVQRTARLKGAFLWGLLLLCGSCRVVSSPQLPAEGAAFELRRLGDQYAVTLDRLGEPLGIWDLGYPVARREGDEDRMRFPVRLVNFADPDEAQERRADERWSFGYRSFIAGLVSFNVLKWYQTMDLFDVREARKARRAMLQAWLRGSGEGLLSAAGLDGSDRVRAVDLLGSELEGAPQEPALREQLRKEFEQRDLPPEDNASFIELGNDQVAALVDGTALAVFDSGEGPAVWFGPGLSDAGPSDGWSLGLNTVGTMALTGGGVALGFPIGTPFSILSSIVPLVPYRREDKGYGARGRLLGYLLAEESKLPPELSSYRGAWIEALRAQLKAGNRYWPQTPTEFTEEGWLWLQERSGGSAGT